MHELSNPGPGKPDHESAARYLWWVARSQARGLFAAAAAGIVWMVAQALMPAVIGHAIDAGVTARDGGALASWTAVLLGLGVIQAGAGVLRHRLSVLNWIGGSFLSVQVTVRKVVQLGATLPKRLAAGEVVSIGVSDVMQIGSAMDIVGRGSGSVVAIGVVAVIMVTTYATIGWLTVAAVPAMAIAMALLIHPLHRRQHVQRDRQAQLATRASDIVAGLRVLRGIGGEDLFAARYRTSSRWVMRAGISVGAIDSMLAGAEILLPGLLVAVVVWIGARMAAGGAITPGQLVACYGYAVFLTSPVRTLTEATDKVTKAHVAARRVIRLLQESPEITDAGLAALPPEPGAVLVDHESGLVVRPGQVTGVAAARATDAAAIADRLGRFADGEVTYGGIRLADLPLDAVRRTILVSCNSDRLFAERLRDELSPPGTLREPPPEALPAEALPAEALPAEALPAEAVLAEALLAGVLHAASASDVVDALPEALDTRIAEAGREFSGGQQQRLKLARALAADPPVLVLVEPTSAVDAHTEAAIAARLAQARAGRTTVVAATSPLVLSQAHHVVFVDRGRVVAEGSHADLVARHPGYAATVTRREEGHASACHGSV